MVEYNRQPGSKVLLRWLKGNNHLPGVELPAAPNHWTRRFWDKEHLFIAVADRNYGKAMLVFTGGGDYGARHAQKLNCRRAGMKLL